jgi:hypothetical protein
MSRTGVEIVVEVDGLRLDDGCIDWGAGYYGDPWTETRRNLHINPRADATGAVAGAFLANGTTETGSFGPAIGDFSSSRRATRAGASAGPIGWRLLTTGYLGNTTYRVRFLLRSSVSISAGSAVITARPDVLTGTNAGAGVPLPALPAGVDVEVDVMVTSANVAAGTNPGFTVATPSVPLGTFLEGAGVIIETAATAGSDYFDGGTISPDPAFRNRWTSTANASATVHEVGTWTADLPPDLMPQGVVGTDGLSITWGRSTTVDQPEPSTCTFRVVDDPGGATVLDVFRLGARVDVFATADIAGPGTDNTFTDPTFAAEVRSSATNATVSRTTSKSETPGGYSAMWSTPDPSKAAIVNFPPGQLQAPGTNPLAWIGIQSTRGGETWTIRGRVWVPAAMTVRMRPVAYSGPYAAAATPLTAYTTSVVGTGAWVTLEVVFSPGIESSWIGLQFESSGGGTWGELDPAITWATMFATGYLWRDFSNVWVDSVEVLGPQDATSTSVLVFSGRITDMEGAWSNEWGEPQLDITATDFLGDLGNRYIGDTPWPMETVAARTTRILTLAKRPDENPIQIEIDPSLTGINLTWDDVDHQAAAGLLAEVAESVDGVLWSATHPVIGPYVRLEDPALRLALYELGLVGGIIRIVPVDFTDDPDAPPSISACDIIRDPVTFYQDVSDIATRVSVTWQEQTVDEDLNPTTVAHRVEAVNEGREVDAGTRAVNLDSLVVTAPQAQAVADQLIARLGASWRISGLTVADADMSVPDATAATSLIILLNGVTRGGQPLLLTDLPAWSPTGPTAPIYLEGGTYSFVRGGWDLDLNVSRAAGQGHNAAWDDLPNDPAWIWNAWDPSITWDDLRGVAGP